MTNNQIPEEVIGQVMDQTDIVELVGKYVQLSRKGKNYVGLCPFHSEKTPSFTVAPDKRIYHCFGCGNGGNAIKFVMEVDGLTFKEAVAELAEPLNIPISWTSYEQTGDDPEQSLRSKLIKAHELSAKLYHYILKNTEHGKRAMDYLNKRGITGKMINTFQIGYAPAAWETLCQFLEQRSFDLKDMAVGGLITERSSGGYVDRFRDRIMFPIFDPQGKIIAFSGRVLGDGMPKYLNSPETPIFNKSRLLYNYHLAKKSVRQSKELILFEGFIDVLMAWSAGIENGVATMGTALTEAHAKQIKRIAERVIICYDGDEAGQAAAEKSLNILHQVQSTPIVAILPKKIDPADYIQNEGADRFVKEILQQAVTATKFKLLRLEQSYNTTQEDGRLEYIRSALQLIAALPSPTEREHYLKDLAQDYDYSLDALKQEISGIRRDLEKKRRNGDKKRFQWNNVMNETAAKGEPALLPAYHNAERHLLAIMMHSRDVTLHVQQELGDQFNVDHYAALAAYLYAYYAQHDELQINQFIAMLQNEPLEKTAVSLSMMGANHATRPEVIEDYIRQIKRHSELKHIVRIKKEERDQAERSGDFLLAAQIGKEIIALERGV